MLGLGKRRSRYDDRLRMTGGEWLNHLYEQLMGDEQPQTWMGVRALKNPLDAWVYQEILYEVRPDTVVELGNALGGGTLFLANLLDLIGGGKVIAVDVSHDAFEPEHPRITTITGRTEDVADQVAELCEGTTVVIHDADHSEEAVYRDLHLYGPLVTPGSYLIVEDGVRDLLSDETGPVAAIDRFLEDTDLFERDESRERFLLTYNPGGFLKRRQ
jgi:cephalosporin hydroxylase